MTSLADKIKAIEPVTCSFSVSNGVYVSKEQYTQMRDIAVILAEACENVRQSDLCYGEAKMSTINALTKAAAILKGGADE